MTMFTCQNGMVSLMCFPVGWINNQLGCCFFFFKPTIYVIMYLPL